MPETLAMSATQSSTTTARAPHFYRPELDTLRFGAFLMVLVHHTISDQGHNRVLLGIRNAGSYGVSVFFLLSAYLITELLLREKASTGSISLRRFYVRRVLRIWPLYFGFLFVAFAISLVGHRHEFLFPVKALLMAVFLMGNIAVAHGLELGIGGALWSISVEEQFYLFWPLLIRVLNRRNVLAIGAFVWVASQIATIVQIHMGLPYYPTLWYSSLVQFQFFALGIMLTALPRSMTLPPLGHLFLLAAGVGIFFGSTFTYGAGDYFKFPLLSLGAVSIFVGALGFKALLSGKLEYLGKISYGLYIFHGCCLLIAHVISHRLPFFRTHPYFLVATLPLPLVILIASLSYRYFEMPFLKLKKRFEVVKSRPV